MAGDGGCTQYCGVVCVYQDGMIICTVQFEAVAVVVVVQCRMCGVVVPETDVLEWMRPPVSVVVM